MHLEQRAERTKSPRLRARLMLRAAELYLDRNDLADASRMLDATPARALAPDYLPRRQLLEARLLLANGAPAEALAALERMARARSPATRVLALRTRVEALDRVGRSFDAILARIDLDELLQGDAADENERAIWDGLSAVPAWELERASERLPEDSFPRGWLELAAAVQGAVSMRELRDAVFRWRQRWPNHPAALYVPALAQSSQISPRHVVVFLPSTGPLAAAGKAIRDGILAAWFAESDMHEEQDAAIEASWRSAMDPFASRRAGEVRGHPQITLFDSAQLSPDELLRRVDEIGADFIIGPLAKDRVAALAARHPRVPVLALNYLPDGESGPPPTLTQYGLRAEDEARSLAARVHADGHRHLLLLVAQERWAARIATDLAERWLEPGEVVAQGDLVDPGEVDPLVRKLLHIDASQSRAERIMRILGEQPEFAPRRRHDLDAVLLIAPPTTGRIAASTLAYHYADDLPVYATSHIWNGDRTGRVIDLEGIRFCDIPWRLLDSPLAAEIIANRPDAAGPQGAFYALGIDAWHLHDRLSLLADGLRMFGATGLLAGDSGHRIRRDLMWARFEDGYPHPIPLSTSTP